MDDRPTEAELKEYTSEIPFPITTLGRFIDLYSHFPADPDGPGREVLERRHNLAKAVSKLIQDFNMKCVSLQSPDPKLPSRQHMNPVRPHLLGIR